MCAVGVRLPVTVPCAAVACTPNRTEEHERKRVPRRGAEIFENESQHDVRVRRARLVWVVAGAGAGATGTKDVLY